METVEKTSIYWIRIRQEVIGYRLLCRTCGTAVVLSPADGAAMLAGARPALEADRRAAAVAGPSPAALAAKNAGLATTGAALAWGAALLLLFMGLGADGAARGADLLLALILGVLAAVATGVALKARADLAAGPAQAPALSADAAPAPRRPFVL